MQVHECARIAMSNIENDIERYEMIDINKLVKSFTLDSIAKITCSIKVDSYQNWDSELRKIADSSFNVNILKLGFMFPWILCCACVTESQIVVNAYGFPVFSVLGVGS